MSGLRLVLQLAAADAPRTALQMFTQPYIFASSHLLIDTSWISIPGLKSFLEARAGDAIMIASPAVPARVKRESEASLVVDLTIKSEPVTATLPVRTRSQLEGGREVIELLSDSDNDEAQSPSTSAAGGITDQGNRVRRSYPELNSANDSSSGDLSPESGCSDPTVDVRFAHGEESIACRRKRQNCRGCQHCEALDKSLVEVTRYELGIATRDVVLEARRETRRHAGVPAEQRATAYLFPSVIAVISLSASRFFDRVKSTACKATHSDGKPCGGKETGSSLLDSVRWVDPHFKGCHRTHSIPESVDEGLLIKHFDDKPLADDDSADANECSRIVHPHTGGHSHIIKGKGRCSVPDRASCMQV
ncbi:hypothetical protein DFH09DRAFT_1086795 [Mycena vulgaris]|nr:hypothetical protein DFH09DRAFT_1086795 [Mycena vulgaris]